jgi:prophage regulatory protein
MYQLPETGFLRLSQIIGDPGDPDANPPKLPIPAVIPVCKSTWWAGIKRGMYPRGIKISERCTAWRVEDIRALIEQAAGGAQ